jgi:hypothetical protein
MSSPNVRLDAHSVPVTDLGNQQAAQQATQALDLLRQEARTHQEQIDNTGLVGRAVAWVSQGWHQSDRTGGQIDDLSRKIEADLATGKTADASALAGGAKTLVAADQTALKSRAEVTQIGSGVVQAAGLFMAGRKGFILAGTAAALDAFKPGSKDSFGEQLSDVGLGVTRALALKGAFAAAGKFNLGMATTAVGLGVGSRFGNLALNRKTYLDTQTGQYDAKLGAQRIWSGTADKGALASDIITLVVARGALGKLNAATDGALTANKLWSTMAVGGVFGVSQGSVAEVIRQGRAGTFEPGQFALHTLLSGATSMAGAAISGAGGQRLAMAEAEQSALLAKTSPEVTGVAAESIKSVVDLPNVRDALANFPGSASREYQLVGGKANVSATMEKSIGAFAFVRVREASPGGGLGPEQNLLIQHGGEGIPFNMSMAAKGDLIATCNPELLPAAVRDKYILPSVQQTLWLTQKPGGRLSFTDYVPTNLGPGDAQPVALGNRPVSEILKDPSTLDRIYFKPNPHDLGLYSEVLRGFKIPAKRVLVGGADSLVLELADDSILKITHQEWNPEWGHRTYVNPQGQTVQFDARIIGKHQTFDRPDGMATYYIQERAKTPVNESTVPIFASKLDYDGRYSFWDRDATQLGIADRGNGKSALVLLDYDAVRPPHLVPKDLKVPHEDRFDRSDRFDRGDRFDWEDRFGRR